MKPKQFLQIVAAIVLCVAVLFVEEALLFVCVLSGFLFGTLIPGKDNDS